MRRIVLLFLAISLAAPTALRAEVSFDDFFAKGALRVDLIHTGTKGEERFSLDEIIHEPIWAGNPNRLIDKNNLGAYLLRVFDATTNELIFSRGFGSLFWEWLTTEEAASGAWRSMHETVRMPWPKRPVQVTIAARGEQGMFREIYSIVVDPASHLISRERRNRDVEIVVLEENGPPAEKVDVLIIADGYGATDRDKLMADLERFAAFFFSTSPFRELRQRINLRVAAACSADTGPDEPRKGLFADTAVGTNFNTFDSPRYLTTHENRAMRDIAANVPCDAILIMVNSSRYGGGGIFNLWAVFTTDNEYDGYLMMHEFGHSFAGLGDEYYTSSTSYDDFYPKGVEPWEPNVTALFDPAHPKWKAMLTAGVPLPTPDDVEKYPPPTVGAFEGAGYVAKGLYRPSIDCMMFSKGNQPYCPVCRATVERMIRFHSE